MDAVRHQIPNVHGTLRTFQLITRLKQCGFVGGGFKSFLSERQYPLRPVERTYLTTILQGMAHMAEQFDVTEQVPQAWQPLADVESPDHIFQHPDFYYRENHIVVVGQVPES